MTDLEPVAVLGTGALGSVVARALAAAGHPTTAWNRTPARLADLVAAEPAIRAAGTPAEAATAATVVVLAVADDDAAHHLLDVLGGTIAGRTVVNLVSTTPESTRVLAARVGSGYLDGAAMSGTRLVGDPAALFLYGGDPGTFAAVEPVLRALGTAQHVGADPGAASLWDTALLAVILGALAGFHHGAALVGAPVARFAEVVLGHLPFVADVLGQHAGQIDAGRYPADDGSVAVFVGAVEQLAAASVARGVATDVPDALLAVLQRAVAAGHGDAGLGSVAEVLR
ncbi:NAD(P)-binding domain-containing protein [Pseudonocardia sp. CA-107938]|uniref:imine reductase family protein n=1 Tax=Pseudonocardia sp. CA-107938 TaxID=3240021 RepID=UPI003D8C213B